MKILILHALNRRSRKIKSVLEQELILPNYDTNNSYFVHNARMKMSKLQKSIGYDAIIFTSTFLDFLTNSKRGNSVISNFEFLENNDAFKIAFPQDDYWLNEIRDNWFCKIRIDIVFPVCQPKYWEFLYPNYSKSGKMRQGYTGYIHDRHFEMFRKRQPFSARYFHIVYRATKTPLFPNYLGYLKGNLGLKFEKFFHRTEADFKIDVSGSPKLGKKWEQFVGNSRAILGSPSGSSTLVPNHRIAGMLEQYSNLNQDNVESELLKVLPPNCLGRTYTAISPRNIEAGSLGTVQILVADGYSELMEPWTDFIPLEFNEVQIQKINLLLDDLPTIEKISSHFWEKISKFEPLNANCHVRKVVSLIEENKFSSLKHEKESKKIKCYAIFIIIKLLGNLQQTILNVADLVIVGITGFRSLFRKKGPK